MNEKELKAYKKENDVFPWDTGEGYGLIDGHVLADMAHQLTRIADNMDGWEKAFATLDTTLDTTPTPDALVDMCRDTIARLGVLADTSELCNENRPYIIDTRENLFNALADHEKAGG